MEAWRPHLNAQEKRDAPDGAVHLLAKLTPRLGYPAVWVLAPSDTRRDTL